MNALKTEGVNYTYNGITMPKQILDANNWYRDAIDHVLSINNEISGKLKEKYALLDKYRALIDKLNANIFDRFNIRIDNKEEILQNPAIAPSYNAFIKQRDDALKLLNNYQASLDSVKANWGGLYEEFKKYCNGWYLQYYGLTGWDRDLIHQFLTPYAEFKDNLYRQSEVISDSELTKYYNLVSQYANVVIMLADSNFKLLQVPTTTVGQKATYGDTINVLVKNEDVSTAKDNGAKEPVNPLPILATIGGAIALFFFTGGE